MVKLVTARILRTFTRKSKSNGKQRLRIIESSDDDDGGGDDDDDDDDDGIRTVISLNIFPI